MTLTNRQATDAYLHALNEMPEGSKPNVIARMADRMAGAAFDGRDYSGLKQPSPDGMMDIETALFTSLCAANSVNWRYVYDCA